MTDLTKNLETVLDHELGKTFSPSPTNDIISHDEKYDKLAGVLQDAYNQAAEGKGKERHANGKPFDRQPIMEIARMVGIGYQTGQAMKKAQEATSMANRGEGIAAEAELLGAINYLAAAVMLIREQ